MPCKGVATVANKKSNKNFYLSMFICKNASELGINPPKFRVDVHNYAPYSLYWRILEYCSEPMTSLWAIPGPEPGRQVACFYAKMHQN